MGKEQAAGGRKQLGYISGRDWGVGGGGVLRDWELLFLRGF